ncbi:MAG: type 4a pilus biogenesis protein PilO [bacterium]
MVKKRLTKLEQMGIVALIAVIACFFYVKKVYEPECKKFKELKGEWDKLSKEVKGLKWQVPSKDTFSSIQEEELEKAKSELKKANFILVNEKGLAETLIQISRLTKQYNLKIKEISPADEKEPQDKKGLSLNRTLHNLVMAGNFLDFKNFLKEIKSLSKLVTIEKVLIERESEGENLKIILLLAIYYK